jgi:selenocysteine lyase/cysteine desulfurase
MIAQGGLVAGTEAQVPLLGGGRIRYVNFDNAASTPPFHAALDAVNGLAPWYSNVHRGAGFKSRLSTWAYETARADVEQHLGLEREASVVLFTRNTSEAINMVASRYAFAPGAVVLTTSMEHHSNELPWRRVAEVVHVGLTPCGAVDEDDLAQKLERYQGRVALLAVTGASNVTGLLNPVHTWAEWAHAVGARILVDAAQLAPHRPIDLGHSGEPHHLDFLAFSGHKFYAPFGAGVLVGPRDCFAEGEPYQVGGGTVDLVAEGSVSWTGLPAREEAGTPCIMGAVALGAALRTCNQIGWRRIMAHEAELTTLALQQLGAIPGLTIYGGAGRPRVGVIAFNLAGIPHGLVAGILSQEWGIGTRSGCFCAHSYIRHLLRLDERWSDPARLRAVEPMPGAVRISFGVYNTCDEVLRLGEALRSITEGNHASGYRYDPDHGEYAHPDAACDYAEYFRH